MDRLDRTREITAAGPLNDTHLRLAVADAIIARWTVERTQAELWREDPDAIAAHHDRITVGRMDITGPVDGRYGIAAEKARLARRAIRNPRRNGLTLAELAKRAGISRETLAALLEGHGYLETVQFGRDQRRRLVSAATEAAGFGHNAIGRMGRAIRSARGAFPVFYPESADQIIWSIDYAGLVARAAAITSKRDRLAWVLQAHFNLPNAEVASLTGYTVRGVEKARAKARQPESSVRSYKGDTFEDARVEMAA